MGLINWFWGSGNHLHFFISQDKPLSFIEYPFIKIFYRSPWWSPKLFWIWLGLDPTLKLPFKSNLNWPSLCFKTQYDFVKANNNSSAEKFILYILNTFSLKMIFQFLPQMACGTPTLTRRPCPWSSPGWPRTDWWGLKHWQERLSIEDHWIILLCWLWILRSLKSKSLTQMNC